MPRSRMILLSPLLAVLASGSATAYGQGQGAGRAGQPAGQAAGQPQSVNDPVKMKWLLGKWAEQSAKLKTLDVHIDRIDKDPKWKDEVHFEGRAVFKSPNLAYLDFKEVKLTRDDKGQLAPVINPQNGKPVTTPTETIVCGRNEVWQYLFKGRQIFVYPAGQGRTAAGAR